MMRYFSRLLRAEKVRRTKSIANAGGGRRRFLQHGLSMTLLPSHCLDDTKQHNLNLAGVYNQRSERRSCVAAVVG